MGKGLLRLFGRASAAVGRLDGVTARLQTPGAFLWTYVRKEAVLSSQIEGTQSSLTDLLLHENEQADPGGSAAVVVAADSPMATILASLPVLRARLEERRETIDAGRRRVASEIEQTKAAEAARDSRRGIEAAGYGLRSMLFKDVSRIKSPAANAIRFSADQKAKAKRVNEGASQMYEWAVKHDLLMVLGGDMFGVADGPRQAVNMTKMIDVGLTPQKILKMGTSDAATVIGWSGDLNPYKDAYPDLSAEEKAEKGIGLGVVEEGAYADLILIEGNPLEDIKILEDYENNMKVIIRDGQIWKNTL